MTWLYLPETCFPSAPVSEALNSASLSPLQAGERLHAASATWRGKHQPPQVWSRRWRQGGFIRLLSGLTLPHSTADAGVDAWISLLAAIRARTTATPEGALGQMAPVSSHQRFVASPRSAGLILSSARTSRGTQANSAKLSPHHWKGWATALRQEYSARPKPKTPCSESDCSSWPSAKVARGGYEIDPKTGRKLLTLEGAAVNWAGPSASDANRGGIVTEAMTGISLTQQVNGLNWPGPMASDDGQKATQATHQTMLCNGARYWTDTLLPSSPDQPIAGGSMSSTDGPNSNQPSVKRKLNPIFVEALMRWPTGLSGFARPETAWTRWWQLMPSYLSMLCCTAEAEQGDLFGEVA